MEIRENELVKVSFKKDFLISCILDEKNIILDSILVYGMKDNNVYETPVDFEIGKKNDNFCICPIEEEEYDSYHLIAYQLCEATIVDIKREDYINFSKETNGNFSFIMKGN